MLDAIVIGGGPAGLQAALTLGRMNRTTVLVDAGLVDGAAYRNATVPASHNTLTLDGVDPAELRRRGRAEIATYAAVEVRAARAESVSEEGGTFSVRLDDGSILDARNLILATGVVDTLPAIPGLAAAWGDRVAHCPFCHGHELAGSRVAILGVAPHTEVQGAMLRHIGAEVAVHDPADVTRVEPRTDGLRVVRTDGAAEDVAAVFVATVTAPRAPFADQLGLALQESGAIAIDAFGRTSVEGVYAAGDIAHSDAYPRPLWSIAAAVAAGQLAATAVVQRFVALELEGAASR
jgi:thioredoxin reductase